MPQLVDRAMMESVYPADCLVTVDESALGPITHEPSRRLLRDVGLPDQNTGWFQTVEDLAADVADKGWPEGEERYPDLPYAFAEWVGLGGIPYDNMCLDAATGAVYCIPDDGEDPYLLNSSLDAFVFFLYSVEKERPNYDARFENESYQGGADERLLALMEATDPIAVQNPESTWHMVLDYVRTFGM